MARGLTRAAASVCLLALAGCGGDGGGGTTTASVASGAGRPTAGDRAAVERVVRRWVDDDDCSLMSDRYAAEGYASVAAGEKACEAATDPGLEAGEYTVDGVTIRGRRAQARLVLEPAGQRIYLLVRGGAPGWEIDGVSQTFLGLPGVTFPYRPRFAPGGGPHPHALMTVLGIQTGRGWARARIRVQTRGKGTFRFHTGHFRAVDARGRRSSAGGRTFRPSLGRGVVKLTGNDAVTGYLGFRIAPGARLADVRFAPGKADPLVWKAP